MSIATTYRTCPRSGLQFESHAEKLMIANAVAAVVFLLIGGILAGVGSAWMSFRRALAIGDSFIVP